MKIFEFLEDTNGKISAIRVALLVWLVTICFNSVYLTVMTQKLVGADPSMITGLGILLGGKVIQGYTDSKQAEPDSVAKSVTYQPVPTPPKNI